MRRVLMYLKLLPIVVVILWMGHSIAQITLSDIDRSRFMEVKRAASHSLIPFWHAAVAVHVVSAVGALALGLLAFRWAGRSRWDRHRLAGKGYAVCVLTSALSSVPLIFSVTGGWPTMLGFGLLYVLWLTTTGLTILRIKQHDVAAHRRWAARSYAVTLANLTLHLLWPTLILLTDEDIQSYTLSVALSGPLNLAICEGWMWWQVRRQQTTPPAR